MTQASKGPGYVTVWRWLVGLLVVAVVAAYVPITKTAALALIFATAAAKAVLVARHYMHLKTETVLIYAIAGIPVLLVVGFALTLVPDIVFGH